MRDPKTPTEPSTEKNTKTVELDIISKPRSFRGSYMNSLKIKISSPIKIVY